MSFLSTYSLTRFIITHSYSLYVQHSRDMDLQLFGCLQPLSDQSRATTFAILHILSTKAISWHAFSLLETQKLLFRFFIEPFYLFYHYFVDTECFSVFNFFQALVQFRKNKVKLETISLVVSVFNYFSPLIFILDLPFKSSYVAT